MYLSLKFSIKQILQQVMRMNKGPMTRHKEMISSGPLPSEHETALVHRCLLQLLAIQSHGTGGLSIEFLFLATTQLLVGMEKETVTGQVSHLY